ncbi:MAG: hypothetical protein ABIW19_08500 [Vicinamibacterales bacterium]
MAMLLVINLRSDAARAQSGVNDEITEGFSCEGSCHMHEGDTVLVYDQDQSIVRGRITRLTFTAITLATPGGVRTIPARSVTRITHQDSIGNGAGIGAIAGLAAGAALGTLGLVMCGPDAPPSECRGYAMLFAVLGAGIGAGIGASTDALIRDTLYASSGRTPRDFRPSITAGAAGGITNGGTYGRFVSPVAAMTSVAYLSRRGIGLDVQFARSVRPSREVVPCVRIPSSTAFAPDLRGTCAGPGVRAVERSAALSASLVLATRERRARPYASAGLALDANAFRFPFARSTASGGTGVKVIDLTPRVGGVAAALGTGAWLRVSQHVAIRPCLDILVRTSGTDVRASVGVTFSN